MDNSYKLQSFRDLRVWQSAYGLSIAIYKTTSTYPKHEQFGLSSQMQRAAVSVCSNIAEGFGRRSVKEKDQFFSIANGSLTELENQVMISEGIEYISKDTAAGLLDKCTITHKMLVTLQKVNRQKGAGGR